MRPVLATVLLLSSIHIPNAMAKFEAHEWGTFTSLVGSNGITQHGMYHEDEELPAFVHGFGVTQEDLRAPIPAPVPPPRKPCRQKFCFGDEFFANNLITQKMETPVIYFYSDVKRDVTVNVKFPEGVVTDTYPAPIRTSPTVGDIREAANGDTTFQVEVLPETQGMVPLVETGNIYGHARNVASNLVRTGKEQEKFIFYRGIGRFQPRISITSEAGNLQLNAARAADEPQALFLVHVSESGGSQLLNLGALKAGRPLTVAAETIRGLREGKSGVGVGSQQSLHLIAGLVQAGLKADEARAMVDTWEHGYLKVPGLRLLYILPKAEVDEILPLTMAPAPEKIVRAFVGRIEVMLDTEEDQLLDRILREKDQFNLHTLGRFAEPMLRRVEEVYRLRQPFQNQEVLARFRRLIEQAAKNE